MKSLSDVVNASEDCSGVISSTPVTVLFFLWQISPLDFPCQATQSMSQ